MASVSTALAIQDKFSATLNKAQQGINRVVKAMDKPRGRADKKH